MPKTFMVQVGDQFVVLVQRGEHSQEYFCGTRELAQRWMKLLQSPLRTHVTLRPAA